MANLPKPSPVPFKLAVVGLVFCVGPSGDVRAEIQEVVLKALDDMPNIEVSAQFFQFHDVDVKAVSTDGQ